MRKRLLLVDEAWILMQYPDSARYLYSLAKRARKYFLGLSIISQDVEDFLSNEQGRAIINNSSMQILLKQSPAAVEKLAEVFNLTEGEKFLLLESDVGEGLFFAGSSHVAIKVIASYSEDQIITTDPRQLLEQQQAKQAENNLSGPAIDENYSARTPASTPPRSPAQPIAPPATPQIAPQNKNLAATAQAQVAPPVGANPVAKPVQQPQPTTQQIPPSQENTPVPATATPTQPPSQPTTAPPANNLGQQIKINTNGQ